MKRAISSKASGVLLIVGAISAAASKWYLVWIAQSIGGPQGLGEYGLIFAFATPVFVIAQLGLRTIFLSLETAFPWKSYVVIRAAGMLLGSIALIVFIVFGSSVSVALGLAVLALKILDSVVDLEVARVQYANNMLAVAVVSIVGAVLTVVFASIAAIITGSLWIAVSSSALASSVSVYVARTSAKKVPYVPSSSRRGIGSILSASFPVTGAQLLGSLLIYAPTIFLGVSSDIAAVGVFVGVAYILTVSDLIGATLAKLLITPLRRLKKDVGNEQVVRHLYLWSLKLFLASAPFLGAFVLFGSPALQLVYGPAFRLDFGVLLLFAIGALFLVISHVQSVGLNVLNRYYSVVMSFAAACAISIGTGAILSFLHVSPLVLGSAMAASGAVGRAAFLTVSVYAACDCKKRVSRRRLIR